MNDKALEALKVEMLKAAEELRHAEEREANTGKAIDSMERKYCEGYLEGLGVAVATLMAHEKVGA